MANTNPKGTTPTEKELDSIVKTLESSGSAAKWEFNGTHYWFHRTKPPGEEFEIFDRDVASLLTTVKTRLGLA